MGNLMKPKGRANRAQTLKKKSLEITSYNFKISSSNLISYLLSVIYFLSRTQVCIFRTENNIKKKQLRRQLT